MDLNYSYTDEREDSPRRGQKYALAEHMGKKYMVFQDGYSEEVKQDVSDQFVSEEKYYTVQHGDTLGSIGSKYGLSLDQMTELNPQVKSDPDILFPGEKLRLN
ncbi:MAG TPA: LysM domain-containing protein [Candidatus Sulfotelmatobacter sp.]|nr:LysM domain-containing protein [Candidatus Sulfotelmatobacter sp.]